MQSVLHNPSACASTNTALHCGQTAHCGAFTLLAGRALSLQPRERSVLRIAQGSAWVTLPSKPGDHFYSQAIRCW